MSETRAISKPARVTVHGTEYVLADDYDRLMKAYRAALRPPVAKTVKGLNTEAWREWLKYRQECGKRAYKTDRVAKWLAQYPEQTQQEIVARSVSKEWQGLYDPPETVVANRRAPPQLEEKYL
jgi:hypothetical protein